MERILISRDLSGCLIDGDYYGINSVVIFKLLPNHPRVLNLIEQILSLTYKTFLGDSGLSFLRKYILVLRSITTEEDDNSIKIKILDLREEFSLLGLHKQYTNVFRDHNLLSSLSLIDSRRLKGRVIDIGSDDNRLGKVLLHNYTEIDYVLGTDVNHSKDQIYRNNLVFRKQDNGCKLPASDSYFDVAICRYSLHHMRKIEQISILSEIKRALKPNGMLAVYENSFSATMLPLDSDSYSLHRQFQALSNLEKTIIMPALDIFSLGIKEKEQHFPFTFRTMEDWLIIFQNSFCIEEVKYFGIPIVDLHQQPLALILLWNCK